MLRIYYALFVYTFSNDKQCIVTEFTLHLAWNPALYQITQLKSHLLRNQSNTDHACIILSYCWTRINLFHSLPKFVPLYFFPSFSLSFFLGTKKLCRDFLSLSLGSFVSGSSVADCKYCTEGQSHGGERRYRSPPYLLDGTGWPYSGWYVAWSPLVGRLVETDGGLCVGFWGALTLPTYC